MTSIMMISMLELMMIVIIRNGYTGAIVMVIQIHLLKRNHLVGHHELAPPLRRSRADWRTALRKAEKTRNVPTLKPEF